MLAHCNCRNICVDWSSENLDLQPRACQCEYCKAQSAAYIGGANTRLDVVVASADRHRIVRHGSRQAQFHECLSCEQLVFVSAEIDGGMYGVVNVFCLENTKHFAEAIPLNFSQQSAEEKSSRWQKNWCSPVTIVFEG